MNSNLRTALIAICAALIAVLVYSQTNSFLERRHQLDAQRQEIQKGIAENTASLTEFLELETKPSTITYGEMFERSDDRLKKIGDANIQVATSQLPNDEKEDLKTYLDGMSDVLRLQIAKYRKALILSNDLDTVKRQEEGLDYSNEYELKALSSAREDLVKAFTDSSDAQGAFASQLVSFRRSVADLRSRLSSYILLDDTLLVGAISKNAVKPSGHK